MPGLLSSALTSFGRPSQVSLGSASSTEGRAEVRAWIDQLFELAEGVVHTEIEQVTELTDGRVFLAVVLTARGRGSGGVPFEMPAWSVIWFAEGLVTRRQVFWTRDEALEAAGLCGIAAALLRRAILAPWLAAPADPGGARSRRWNCSETSACSLPATSASSLGSLRSSMRSTHRRAR